nr:unnamed protein product [Callosobruchus chinensis]
MDINCEVLRDPLPLVHEDVYHPSLSVICNINVNNEKPFTTNALSTYNIQF